MSKIIELRNKRNTLWEQTKAFLEQHRDENGLVEASAVEQYNKMASDVKALGDEIQRLEDQMEMDAKLSAATSAPVHADPKAGQRKANVRPTATAEYPRPSRIRCPMPLAAHPGRLPPRPLLLRYPGHRPHHWQARSPTVPAAPVP